LDQNNKTTTNTKDTDIMAKALSKSQLTAAIAEKAEITKKQAGEILEHLASLAYKHAKDTFTLPGIGKLVLKDRAARMGRNPKTGEAIQIKAKRVVKFRVAKAAKDAILGTK
jgi:DNA-binding protein HU-beta